MKPYIVAVSRHLDYEEKTHKFDVVVHANSKEQAREKVRVIYPMGYRPWDKDPTREVTYATGEVYGLDDT